MSPTRRLLGGLFGTLLGTGSIATFYLLAYLPFPDPRTAFEGSWFMLACAGLLGAVAGATLPGAHRRRRTYLLGVLGPGLVACLVVLVATFLEMPAFTGTAAKSYVISIPVWLVWISIFSLFLVPLSLPCALLAEQFNDPVHDRPGRQRRWLAVAALPWLVTAALLLAHW